jgi:hypothetical protein
MAHLIPLSEWCHLWRKPYYQTLQRVVGGELKADKIDLRWYIAEDAKPPPPVTTWPPHAGRQRST